MIWKAIVLIFVAIAVLMYLLCVNSGRISRMEEEREWEERHKK